MTNIIFIFLRVKKTSLTNIIFIFLRVKKTSLTSIIFNFLGSILIAKKHGAKHQFVDNFQFLVVYVVTSNVMRSSAGSIPMVGDRLVIALALGEEYYTVVAQQSATPGFAVGQKHVRWNEAPVAKIVQCARHSLGLGDRVQVL